MLYESFDFSTFLAEKSPQYSVSLSSVLLPVPSCKDLSGSMKYNYWNRFLKKAACKCLIGTLCKEKLQGNLLGRLFFPAVQLYSF